MNKVYIFIIGVLVVFVLLQNKGCVGGGDKPTSDTLVVHDTTWVKKDSLIYSKPLPAKIIHDSLFIHSDVYETGFDYELSVIGYYNNHPDIHKVICKLMNNPISSVFNKKLILIKKYEC